MNSSEQMEINIIIWTELGHNDEFCRHTFMTSFDQGQVSPLEIRCF